MSHHEQPSVTYDHTADDDDDFDYIAGMMETFAQNANQGERIQLAYESGDTDKGDRLVNDLVDRLIAQDPVYQDNLARLKHLRSFDKGNSDEAKAIIASIRDLFSLYQKIVVNELGLPGDAAATQIVEARDKVHEHIQNATTKDDALQRLGIVSFDETTKGKAKQYHWNEQLFPEEVTAKWNAYIISVCAHTQAAAKSQKNQDAEEYKIKVKQADSARVVAHNAVTHDVNEVLSELRLLDSDWGFTKARELVANIRDSAYPNGVSSEEAERLETENQEMLRVLQALSQK